MGISTRQLQRRFRAAVGIAPKVFCRIQRFQQVVRAMDNPSHDWTAIATGAGYYDQAHLIRDFRQFAGKTPSALLKAELKLGRLFA
jgi:AraC-like DNA-binding protein